jgi:hypothetical protein
MDGRIPIKHMLLETLVDGISTPLKNMRKPVGMMTFPTEWTVIKLHGSKPPTRWLFMAISCSTPFLVLETGRPVPVLDILDARAQDGDLRMIQPSFS